MKVVRQASRDPSVDPAIGKVDIVLTCHDDGRYLREAIDSLGPERSGGKGVIVVNDGSTDPGTLEALDGLRAMGCRVIDQSNKGLSAARNTGWRASMAPYILFLDADNRIDPSYPTKAARVMDASEEVAFVYGDRKEFGEREEQVEQVEVGLGTLLVGNRIDACAVVRRSVLEALGGFDEAMRSGYEDWELWIRILANRYRAVHVPEPLFHYRVRQGSLSSVADDPVHRAAIVRYVTTKHQRLFATHARHVVAELHRIQAHDKHLLQDARTIGDQARSIAEEALNTARTAREELDRARAEHQQARDALEMELARVRADAETEREHIGHLEVEQARAEAALRELEAQKDTLSEEAHRLVGEVDKAMQALRVQRAHSNALQALVGQYEERIRRIESGRLWRLRRQYYKMRALLRTSSDTSRRGWKWLRRVTFLLSDKGRHILRKFLAKLFKALYLFTEDRPVRIIIGNDGTQHQLLASGDPYQQWMSRHFARDSDLRDQGEQVDLFGYRPLVSVVMPVFDPPVQLLDAAIGSVLRQTYPDLELCIADDKSRDPAVRACLEKWSTRDQRVRVVFRATNGHISRASNSALELAQGDFVALMDHDDLLAPEALFHVVRALNRRRDLDVLYTDEDKVDEEGRHSEPHFKPQWCPDHLLSRNYFGHLVVLRRTLINAVGGFRPGFEGSQDYDLLLRVTERTDRIARIPRVLYHWRVHPGSAARGEEVKPYAYEAARMALTEALERRGEPAEVSFLDGFRGYGIRFRSPLRGRVSVVIPTKDKAEVLGTCLRSLFALTDHPDFEVIVVSNNSTERALFELLDEVGAMEPDRFRHIRSDRPFNFSALMNIGTAEASGEHILYLNNDTEIIHADWMRAMHEWSQRPSIGAVGVKLLYHNDTIQHAGVIIGLGGVAGHTFVGTHKDGPGYFNYVNTINNYSAVTAACMMVERRKLDEIGGWDEGFTVEYNDVDLCLRLRERGYHNVYLPHVSLYHYESLTRGHPHMTRESYERHLREVKLFKDRWEAYIADDPCYDPNLSRGVHDFQFAP